MKVKFSPLNSDLKAKYTIRKESLIVEIDGEVTDFDFHMLPDGEMQDCQHPILSAKKIDGEVFIELVTPYGDNAPQSVLFPSDEFEEMNGVIYTNITEGY